MARAAASEMGQQSHLAATAGRHRAARTFARGSLPRDVGGNRRSQRVAGLNQLSQNVIVAQSQTRHLHEVNRQLADKGGVSPEKGEPGADSPSAG